MVCSASGALVTLATIGCLAFLFAWAYLHDLVLWPKGELFSPLDTFRNPKVSGFAISSVVIDTSGYFSYYAYFRLLSLFVCLDRLA